MSTSDKATNYLLEKVSSLDERIEYLSTENFRLKVESRERLDALRRVEQELETFKNSRSWKVFTSALKIERKILSLKERFDHSPHRKDIEPTASCKSKGISDVIDVIIPIYRGLSETKRCFESVFANPQKTKFEIVVVNDNSPEPELTRYLRFLRSEGKITLIENPSNLGFAGAVTVGVSQHADRDVILLNSDTIVSNNWLDRIVHCAHANGKVGTVTPFSNNGAITSYPKVLAVNEVPAEISLAELDLLFAQLNAGKAVQLPVGVGFCMYISRECFDTINGFDIDQFGAGYGEENDLCLRAEAAGFKNLLCADTFVYHAGAVSFREKEVTLKRKATNTLLKRFPDYLQRVADYLRDDPSLPLRTNIDLARAERSGKPARLILSDNRDWSVQLHLRNRAARDSHVNIFVIAPKIQPQGPFDYELLWFNPGEFLGLPLALDQCHQQLQSLTQSLRIQELECHFLRKPNPSLTAAIRCIGLPPHVVLHEVFGETDLSAIVEEIKTQPGSKFFVPSAAALEAVGRALSIGLEARADLWMDSKDPITPKSRTISNHQDNLRVAVIGPVSEAELRTIQLCAVSAAEQSLNIEFHLIGNCEAELFTAPKAHLVVHCDAELHEVGMVLDWLKPHILLYCGKESSAFSYRLEQGLKSQLPIAATKHGDYEARLTGRPLTWLLDAETAANDWLTLLDRDCRQTFMPAEISGDSLNGAVQSGSGVFAGSK